jgi:hypothetical protein
MLYFLSQSRHILVILAFYLVQYFPSLAKMTLFFIHQPAAAKITIADHNDVAIGKIYLKVHFYITWVSYRSIPKLISTMAS